MKFEYESDIHYVVYIDYQGSVPHSVITAHYVPNAVNGPYWCRYNWDGFLNENDKKDLRLYQSGAGGDVNEIDAPQWADGHIGEYWLAEKAKELKLVDDLMTSDEYLMNLHESGSNIYQIEYKKEPSLMNKLSIACNNIKDILQTKYNI